MDKSISYKEQELKDVLSRINNNLETIKFWFNLMQEQVEGKRNNVDLSDYIHLKKPVSNIDECIKLFNIDIE